MATLTLINVNVPPLSGKPRDLAHASHEEIWPQGVGMDGSSTRLRLTVKVNLTLGSLEELEGRFESSSTTKL